MDVRDYGGLAHGAGITAEDMKHVMKRFFVGNNFPPWGFYVGSSGIALNPTTRRHPRLGGLLVAGDVAGGGMMMVVVN